MQPRNATTGTAVSGSLVGRDPELAAVEAALEAAVPGPNVVLLDGPAGIGKSTIWAAAVHRAEAAGWTLLSARAVASESQLALTVLADLLGGVDDALVAGLAEPQRRALEAALLRSEPATGPVEGRLLGTAVRSVLERLGSDRAVLIAIDDLQWADAGSANILAFALRRVRAATVVLLGARRTPLPLPLDIDEVAPRERVVDVELGPLSVGALHELLKRRRHEAPSRATLVRIHEASGGNPLFALEIDRLLDSIGEPPAGEPLPVPRDVRDLIDARLAGLSAAARRVLLAAAILGSASVDRLAAAEARPIDTDLASAISAGLIRRDGGVVTFVHPLYASAVLTRATPAERRAAHARLAELADHPEERARHLAMATVAADPDVAEALDVAAVAALARAAPLAAAELLRLAIDRTPGDDGASLARRQLALGSALSRAGEIAAAQRTYELVAEGPVASARAEARLELAAIHYDTDTSTATAVALCEAAIPDAAGNTELLARVHAILAAVNYVDLDAYRRSVDEAWRLIEQVADPDPGVLGLVIAQRVGRDFERGLPLDPRLVERALELEKVAPNPMVSARFSAGLGTWLRLADDLDGGRMWLERTLQSAIDEGDEASIPFAISHLPDIELRAGDWPRALARAEEHLRVAEELGMEAQRRQAMRNLGLVHAHLGRVDEARRELNGVIEAAIQGGDDWSASTALAALGFLELSLGNATAAASVLLERDARGAGVGFNGPRRQRSDLVEALVAAGRLDEADAALREIEELVTPVGTHSILANVRRADGLLLAARGDLEAARSRLEDALAEHDLAPVAFDRARTLLALGQVRRRLRERGAARDAFEEARAIFRNLGARIWEERAAGELERTGLRRSSGSELTESERRVAELAASGLTNREVAAALFMSPKTVDANLGRAYAKLGIRSRAELGAVMSRTAQT